MRELCAEFFVHVIDLLPHNRALFRQLGLAGLAGARAHQVCHQAALSVQAVLGLLPQKRALKIHGVIVHLFAVPSYANFLITNGSIIFPIYGLDTDEEAVKCLEEIVAGRYVVRPVNAHEIALCGGSIHCFTQQVVK